MGDKVIVNLITTQEDLKTLFLECINEALKSNTTLPSNKEVIPEKLFRVSELAQLFQVSKVTIYEWKNKGILPYIKVNARIRFKKSDVMKLYEHKKRRR